MWNIAVFFHERHHYIKNGKAVFNTISRNNNIHKYTKFYVKRKTFFVKFFIMVKNNLKEVFKEHKVTNRILAKYFKKSESTISLWRNNKRQPSVQQLYEIAKLLRINIHDLIEATDWESTDFETYAEFVERIK